MRSFLIPNSFSNVLLIHFEYIVWISSCADIMLFYLCTSVCALMHGYALKGQNPKVMLPLALSRRKRTSHSLLGVNAVEEHSSHAISGKRSLHFQVVLW